MVSGMNYVCLTFLMILFGGGLVGCVAADIEKHQYEETPASYVFVRLQCTTKIGMIVPVESALSLSSWDEVASSSTWVNLDYLPSDLTIQTSKVGEKIEKITSKIFVAEENWLIPNSVRNMIEYNYTRINEPFQDLLQLGGSTGNAVYVLASRANWDSNTTYDLNTICRVSVSDIVTLLNGVSIYSTEIPLRVRIPTSFYKGKDADSSCVHIVDDCNMLLNKVLDHHVY